MKLLAAGGMFLFLLVGTLAGVRLCLLARRTRELPELAIGCALLFGGSVGLLLGVVGFALQQRGSELASVFLGGAVLSLVVGSSSLAAFNWSVFHPGKLWLRRILYAVVALLFGLFCAGGVMNSYELRSDGVRGWFFSIQLIRCSLLVWSAGESLRYWRLMRRRAAIGLADPLVVNRFALWGVAMAAACVANVFSMFSMSRGVALLEVGSLANLVPAVAGLTAAVCLFVGFMPPAGYRRWLESPRERRAA